MDEALLLLLCMIDYGRRGFSRIYIALLGRLWRDILQDPHATVLSSNQRTNMRKVGP
jgi:hypothetical protein